MHGYIEVGGQILHGTDRHGDWKVTGLEGWWDTPEKKQRDVEIENQDGDYDLPESYRARLITISGRVISPSHEYAHEAMNALNGILARGTGRMVVEGHGPTQWAKVKLAGPIRHMQLTNKFIQFQIPLKAPDPRKYGEEHLVTVLNPAQTFHHGNYLADGKLIVTGSWPGGYRLRSGTGLVSVTEPVVPGKTHVLDFRQRRLRVDGLLVPNAINISDFWETGPGLSGRRNVWAEPISTKSADASANFFLTDTYI